MALSSLFAQLQMQNNDYRNAQRIQNQSLESQVVQQNLGVSQQEADPIAARLTTAQVDSAPGVSGMMLAQAQMQQAGRDFNRALGGLNPQQRREIEGQYQQSAREFTAQWGSKPDAEQSRGLRNQAAMEWARGNIQSSLDHNRTVDPNVNNVFTSGARYQDAQGRFADEAIARQMQSGQFPPVGGR